MELLSLDLIGWLYALLCGAAMFIGAWLILAVHLRGDRAALAARVVEDTILFGIWTLGLAGGIGVLLGRAWSRPVLELFCCAKTTPTPAHGSKGGHKGRKSLREGVPRASALAEVTGGQRCRTG